MRIAVCDDDPSELQKIRNTVEQLAVPFLPKGELAVDTFTNGDALLFDIEKRGGFDLLILDIIIPGMNGMELAREIRENGDFCRIIFLTSSPDFAVESYRVNAHYYLLKPWLEAELASLIGKALLELEEETYSCVIVKNRGRVTRLRLGAIQYIESDNHKLWFHLRDGGANLLLRQPERFSGFIVCGQEIRQVLQVVPCEHGLCCQHHE